MGTTTKDPIQKQSNVSAKPIGAYKNRKQYNQETGATISSGKFAIEKDKYNKDNGIGQYNPITQKATGIASAATDMISGMIPDKGMNTSFKEQQQIGNILMKVNPIVGAAYKAASVVGELTGTNVSKMSEDQAEAADINKFTKMANNLMSYVPGVGVLGKTMDAQKSHLIDSMAGGYSGAVEDINTAGSMAGQNYLFGKGKAEDFIASMNERNKLMTNISMTNTLRKSSDYGTDLAQQNLNRYAGRNYMDMRMGKHGLKLDDLGIIREMLANRKQINEGSIIEKFANGGVIEGDNLMPTGQLHARLHHMDDVDPELAEKLTRKGIPVVALSEGGDVEQVAEIEHSEWIMSKSLTDKIEELRKDGSDEAMIEAGKILVEELLFNTKDEGGVINE